MQTQHVNMLHGLWDIGCYSVLVVLEISIIAGTIYKYRQDSARSTISQSNGFPSLIA